MGILHSTAYGLTLFLTTSRILFYAQNSLSQDPEINGIVKRACAKITNEERMSHKLQLDRVFFYATI